MISSLLHFITLYNYLKCISQALAPVQALRLTFQMGKDSSVIKQLDSEGDFITFTVNGKEQATENL